MNEGRGAGHTRVKCCGMFRAADIEAVNAARPDYCGFVVGFPRSHRSVTPEGLRELRAGLADGIEAVGVFVDAKAELVAGLCAEGVLDLVQLHGHEDEDYLARLRSLTDAPLVKAFKIRSAHDLEAARSSSADYVLLDNGYGTGETFDWGLVRDVGRPYFLAGGLTPGNIPDAVERFHPFAVDISSGIETDRRKDPDKIAAAVAAARGADVRACRFHLLSAR